MSKLHITEAKVLRMAGDPTAALTVIQYAADLYEKQATSISSDANTTTHLTVPVITDTPATTAIELTADLTLVSDRDVQSSSSSSSVFQVSHLFIFIIVVRTAIFVRSTYPIKHMYHTNIFFFIFSFFYLLFFIFLSFFIFLCMTSLSIFQLFPQISPSFLNLFIIWNLVTHFHSTLKPLFLPRFLSLSYYYFILYFLMNFFLPFVEEGAAWWYSIANKFDC